jgi:hypothetical protein
MMIRVVIAGLLFAIALYWTLAAVLELITGAKPRSIFGFAVLRGPQPEPVLTATMWRWGAAFLLAMAAAITLVGVRILQGWL